MADSILEFYVFLGMYDDSAYYRRRVNMRFENINDTQDGHTRRRRRKRNSTIHRRHRQTTIHHVVDVVDMSNETTKEVVKKQSSKKEKELKHAVYKRKGASKIKLPEAIYYMGKKRETVKTEEVEYKRKKKKKRKEKTITEKVVAFVLGNRNKSSYNPQEEEEEEDNCLTLINDNHTSLLKSLHNTIRIRFGEKRKMYLSTMIDGDKLNLEQVVVRNLKRK